MIISFKPSMVIVVMTLSAYYLDLSMKQIGGRQTKEEESVRTSQTADASPS